MFQDRVQQDRLRHTEDLPEQLHVFRETADHHTAEVQVHPAAIHHTAGVQVHQTTAHLTQEATRPQAGQATAPAHQEVREATAGAVQEVAAATAEAVQEDIDKLL